MYTRHRVQEYCRRLLKEIVHINEKRLEVVEREITEKEKSDVYISLTIVNNCWEVTGTYGEIENRIKALIDVSVPRSLSLDLYHYH